MQVRTAKTFFQSLDRLIDSGLLPGRQLRESPIERGAGQDHVFFQDFSLPCFRSRSISAMVLR